MPLKFGGASDLVNCGDGTTIRDLDPCTIVAWAMPTSIAASQRLIGKGLGGTGLRHIQLTTTQIQNGLDRATTTASATANFTNFAAWGGINARYFFASTNKASGGVNGDQKLYLGSLTTPATEPTAYASQTVGAGTINSNAGTNLTIGNRSTGSLQWTGMIWVVGLFGAALSVDDLRWLQTALLDPRFVVPRGLGCVALWRPGVNGTGPVFDESGNNNHGTITGAVPTNDALPFRRAA